ncbi:ATP-binding protein [Maioricimonas sp. JC845]|uniref:AAA family ATPase n=1 Tax=Maioricimonas sp. JC845 TaxID=3232138 RepID=UPI00345A5445
MAEKEVPYHIREIQLPQNLAASYTANGVGNRITGLGRLNVFIGPNNSGKSRLLRGLFSVERLEYGPTDEISERVRKCVSEIRDMLDACETDANTREDIEATLRRCLPGQQIEGTDKIRLIDGQLDAGRCWEHLIRHNPFDVGHLRNQFVELRLRLRDALKRSLSAGRPATTFKYVFVPQLRGLRFIGEDEDLYLKRTESDYLPGTRGDRSQLALEGLDVFTGQTLHRELTSRLLGSLSNRKQVADFERYLSCAFYDARPVTLIPRWNEKQVYIKIGEEKELPVHQLGDGIQHTIILTLPLFLHRHNNLLLFVEEPELYLHPGFQRKFIELVLNEEDANWQVFVATHSHQFLDITIDRSECAVYRLRKELDEESENPDERDAKFFIERATDKDFSLLSELGVRNSSVLLSNCTIWVEGITDRMYLRRYFDLYQEHLIAEHEKRDDGSPPPHRYMEDLHYSFVEYSGDNIEHWSFLDDGETATDVDRLCGRLLLITDADGTLSEDTDEDKVERHKKLENKLGDRFYRLPCREVENLVSSKVLLNVVRMYEGEDADLNEAITEANYREQYLGTFIEQKVLEGRPSKRPARTLPPYSDKSGTIKDKSKFAEKALEHIKSFDDMSDAAKDLAKRMYEFVAKMNGHGQASTSTE